MHQPSSSLAQYQKLRNHIFALNKLLIHQIYHAQKHYDQNYLFQQKEYLVDFLLFYIVQKAL